MANVSSANVSFIWDPAGIIGQDPDFITLRKFINLIGMGLSVEEGDYGISFEAFDYELSAKPFAENGLPWNGYGRWSFGSTMTEFLLPALLSEFIFNNGELDSLNFRNAFQELVFNNLDKDTVNGIDVSGIMTYPQTIITRTNNLTTLYALGTQVREAVERIRQRPITKQFNNNLTLLTIHFDDYEPGADFLEVDGKIELTLDFDINTFEITYEDGTVFDSPSVSQLSEHDFTEYSAHDILNTFYEDHGLTESIHLANELFTNSPLEKQWLNIQNAMIYTADQLPYYYVNTQYDYEPYEGDDNMALFETLIDETTTIFTQMTDLSELPHADAYDWQDYEQVAQERFTKGLSDYASATIRWFKQKLPATAPIHVWASCYIYQSHRRN